MAHRRPYDIIDRHVLELSDHFGPFGTSIPIIPQASKSDAAEASHLGKVNLLEQRWDPLEWHLGLGTGLTLTVGSFIGGCAACLGGMSVF